MSINILRSANECIVVLAGIGGMDSTVELMFHCMVINGTKTLQQRLTKETHRFKIYHF